jgi:DNA ligase-1
MKVSPLLEKLRSTTKRSEKIAILESIKGTPVEYLFKRAAKLTYDPNINYWHKAFEFDDTPKGGLFAQTPKNEMSLDEGMDILENLVAKRVYTGNESYDLIIHTHKKLDDEEKDTFECILDRDLKCGVSVKTINKVWPDFIYDHPYMRASSFNKKNVGKIQFPAISQTKEDGGYQDIMMYDGNIEVRSRYGTLQNNHLNSNMINVLRSEINQNVVLMGEVLVFKDDTRTELMPRQEGNGYLNRSEIDPDRLLHVLWDIVPYDDFKAGKCTIPYSDRFETLKRVTSRLTQKTDQIKLIDSKVVNSIEEVITHFKENAENGLEGTVIKNTDMQWKDGTSRDQVKVKIVFDCEVKIIGSNQGKENGKYVEKLGSWTVQSHDGLFEFNVGTGFSDDERYDFWNRRLEFQKKIVTIKGNDITTSELKPDKYAVYLPRYDKIRDDKTKADSFDKIKEQRDAFLETLNEIKD